MFVISGQGRGLLTFRGAGLGAGRGAPCLPSGVGGRVGHGPGGRGAGGVLSLLKV